MPGLPFLKPNHLLRRTPCAIAVACALTAGPALSQTPISVDMPSDSLRANLLRLGQSAKLSIFFAEETVADVEVEAVSGDFTPEELLRRWTADHCLEVDFIRERFVAITPAERCIDASPTPDGTLKPGELLAETSLTEPPLPVEEILVTDRYVTGSRLRRVNYGHSQPVDIIDREEIRLSGYQSLGELLRYVPAVSGNSTSTLISNGGDGTATITLRGLPASNTLVLLNGRRINGNALDASSADLNTLPLGMIEQIEIVKDGMSAIYGSDAVAGVVNIITKGPFSGVEVDAYGGIAGQGDLGTRQLTVQGGHVGESWSALAGIALYEQDGIFSRDRTRSESSDDRPRGGIDKRSSATAPAFVSTSLGALILAEGADGTSPDDFRPIESEDRFEYRDFTSSIVPSKRYSAYLRANWAGESGLSFFVDGLMTHTRADSYLAPVPIFTGFEAIALPFEAGAPFNPFTETITDVRRRVTELDARRQENRSDTYRLISGLRYQAERLSITASVQFDETRATEKLRNGVHAGRLAEALRADCVAPCVPIDLLGAPGSIDPDMLDFIRTEATVSGRSELKSFVIELDWRGRDYPMEVAAGAEVREERLEVNPDNILDQSLFVAGGNREGTDGDRRVTELYAEAFLPIWSTAERHVLSTQIAGRFSHYSDFGSVFNPRLIVSMELIEGLTFRASVGRGFRAPTLTQIYSARKQSFQQLSDPCSIEENVIGLIGCGSQSDPTLNQFLTFTGGNRDLDPEVSENVSIGFDYRQDWAHARLTLAADWFSIDQKDVVESSAQFIVSENARTGRFADRVLRDNRGNLNQVLATLQNIGERQVTGVDLAGTVVWELDGLGEFTTALKASHIAQFKDKFDPDSRTIERAGTFSDEASGGLGSLPDWKVSLGTSWRNRHWQAHYNIYWVSTLSEKVPLTDRRRTIDDWTTHNVNVSYHGPFTRWIRTTFGVSNLLDETPPFAASAFNDSYDGRTYDITGRFYFVKLDHAL